MENLDKTRAFVEIGGGTFPFLPSRFDIVLAGRSKSPIHNPWLITMGNLLSSCVGNPLAPFSSTSGGIFEYKLRILKLSSAKRDISWNLKFTFSKKNLMYYVTMFRSKIKTWKTHFS